MDYHFVLKNFTCICRVVDIFTEVEGSSTKYQTNNWTDDINIYNWEKENEIQ